MCLDTEGISLLGNMNTRSYKTSSVFWVPCYSEIAPAGRTCKSPEEIDAAIATSPRIIITVAQNYIDFEDYE